MLHCANFVVFQVTCTLYAKIDIAGVTAAAKLVCDAPGILPSPNPTVVLVKISLGGLPGLPSLPLPTLPGGPGLP